MKKTRIEIEQDGLNFVEEVKEKDLSIIKEGKVGEFIESVETAPLEYRCAYFLMDAIQKGIDGKSAAQISEGYYGISASRTRNLIEKYSVDDEGICGQMDQYIEGQRKGINRKLVLAKRNRIESVISK